MNRLALAAALDGAIATLPAAAAETLSASYSTIPR